MKNQNKKPWNIEWKKKKESGQAEIEIKTCLFEIQTA